MITKHRSGASINSKILNDSYMQNRQLGCSVNDYIHKKSQELNLSIEEEKSVNSISRIKQIQNKKIFSVQNSGSKEDIFEREMNQIIDNKSANNSVGDGCEINIQNEKKKNAILVKDSLMFPRVQQVNDATFRNLKQNSQIFNKYSDDKLPPSLMASPYSRINFIHIRDDSYFVKKIKNMQNFKNQIAQQNIMKINEKLEKRVQMLQENTNKKNIFELFTNSQNNNLSSKNYNIASVNTEKSSNQQQSHQQLLYSQQTIFHQQQSNSQKQLMSNPQQSQSLNSLQSSINKQFQPIVKDQQDTLNPAPVQIFRKSPTELIKPYLTKQNYKAQSNKQKAAMLINQISNKIKNISQNNLQYNEKDINNMIQLQKELEKDEYQLKNSIQQQQLNLFLNQINLLNIFQNKQIRSQAIKARPIAPNQDSFSNQEQKEELILCEEEIKLYGQRCPQGYEKLEILGKGGFSVVWLCLNTKTQQKVAAKQIINKKNQESVSRELQFLNTFFNEDGTCKPQFRNDRRLKNMIGLVEIIKDQKDTWIIYELGGMTMSKLFFNMKGDFHNGERVYKINFTKQYFKFIQIGQNNMLKDFIRNQAEALLLLSENKLVHCDIKPENILATLKNDQSDISYDKISLIDFGSALNFNEKGTINLATLEYMPPEVVTLFVGEKNHTNHLNSKQTMIEQLMQQGHMDVIDVWSFGASLIEILTGLPQWLSYKCRVTYNQKSIINTGLFSIRNQDYDKLLQKQKGINESLPNYLGSILPMFDDQDQAELLIDLIAQMLKFNANERIKPNDILKHPFICNTCTAESIEKCRNNVAELFNKNNNNITSMTNINEGISSNNRLKTPREETNQTRIKPNTSNSGINGNKSRSHSFLESNLDAKKYYYDNTFIQKAQSQNKIKISYNQQQVQEKKNQRVKSSAQIISINQHKDSSLLSPNMSIQEIECSKINSKPPTPTNKIKQPK